MICARTVCTLLKAIVCVCVCVCVCGGGGGGGFRVYCSWSTSWHILFMQTLQDMHFVSVQVPNEACMHAGTENVHSNYVSTAGTS